MKYFGLMADILQPKSPKFTEIGGDQVLLPGHMFLFGQKLLFGQELLLLTGSQELLQKL